MDKGIIVIADFTKPFWKDFWKRILDCEVFWILENETDESKKTESTILKKSMKIEGKSYLIRDRKSNMPVTGLLFKVDGNKMILLKQRNGEDKNNRQASVIIVRFCNKLEEVSIASHKNGGTLRIERLPNDKTYHYKTFHHMDEDSTWKKIENLFNDKEKGLFEELWQHIYEKEGEKGLSLRTLKHGLRNAKGTIEPNINGFKYADSLGKKKSEWNQLKEAIIGAKINRI